MKRPLFGFVMAYVLGIITWCLFADVLYALMVIFLLMLITFLAVVRLGFKVRKMIMNRNTLCGLIFFTILYLVVSEKVFYLQR